MGTHEAPADTSMFGSVWVPPKGRGTGRQHRPAFFEDLKQTRFSPFLAVRPRVSF